MRASAKTRSPRSAAISSIAGVTSTVRNSVACGAVNALCTMAAAVCLRTLRIGLRDSRTPTTAAAGRASASTSCRVMSPVGPVPVAWARSTPRVRASARTGGEDRGRSVATGGDSPTIGGADTLSVAT